MSAKKILWGLWLVPCLLTARVDAQIGVAFDAGPDLSVPPPIPAQEQPEVLSRGPVHEAFAEPVTLQLQAGLTAPNQPPPGILEIPPTERPQGEQFVWIPGYWSWDVDRNGYIWVSACWRAAPPRMSWVPGYWSQVPEGWEWIAGFWVPAGVRELEYLPAPPAVDDIEADSLPPSPDTIWVPPCMYWAQGQYVRRAGYWLAARPYWVWVPAHYVVTPRGYVFAEGHWDYSLERRGVLFAPVYFPPAVHGRVGFSYSPSIVIDIGLLQVSLFAYPRYNHYYFGDYYDDAYLTIGIYPWFDSRRTRTWYDPVYEHERWRRQRSEPRWEDRERDEYKRRRADKELRPARTYREQESRLAKLPEPSRWSHRTAQPLAAAVAAREHPLKFERIDTDARQKISREATAVRTFRDERNHWEAKTADPRRIDPAKDSKSTMAPPRERRQAPEPPQERKPVAKAPTDRGDKAASEPSAKRVPAFVPPRVDKDHRPERVQIPDPPVVGGSGSPGIFRKGPPAKPAKEHEGNAGKDIRKNKGRDKDKDEDKDEDGDKRSGGHK